MSLESLESTAKKTEKTLQRAKNLSNTWQHLSVNNMRIAKEDLLHFNLSTNLLDWGIFSDSLRLVVFAFLDGF